MTDVTVLPLPQNMIDILCGSGYTLEDVAVSSPAEISSLLGIQEKDAAKVIAEAKRRVEGGFVRGKEILENLKSIGKISTGSKNLDDLLGGGIETQAITEFFGPFGSGKTQLCFQLAINVQLPEKDGGLDGAVAYIDTENTFRPERIAEIAAAKGLEPEKILENIFVAKAYNSSHQMLLVEKIYEISSEKPIRLIIVDSVTSHFRAEYAGRGMLAERQQKLNRHLHDLLRLARRLNAAVVVTNQVMDRPDSFYGDPTGPVGGHIMGHTATFRLKLKRVKGDVRLVRLIDSPHLPDGETLIKITEKGVEDGEKGKKKAK